MLTHEELFINYCYIFTSEKIDFIFATITITHGLSLGSMKNILMIISNSPHPVSVISYGGLVTTEETKNKTIIIVNY